MLKRTVSSVFYITINNRRLFSLTSILNRQQKRNSNGEYSPQVNNQHRQFAQFHQRSSKSKNRIQQNKDTKEKHLDIEKPQFNKYTSTRFNSMKSVNAKPIEDDDNDIFSEEKDNLTMFGTDKKAFSQSSTSPVPKPSTNAISLNKQAETLNIPLEVLIQPDLRDLYADEDIHRSLDLYVSELRPTLRPFTFDLAYLINESPTLKRFAEMGVDVYRWNQPNAKAKYILTLNFERDCVQHLVFLNELNIKNKYLAQFLGYNPWIFKETIEDLRVRLNYLESKGFTGENISDILIRAPFLLNFSTKMIDSKLSWFMKKFQLKENQLNEFILRSPKLLTLPLQDISDTYFKMNSLLDFEHGELQKMFQQYPKLFIYDYKLIELNFDFLFNEMKITRQRLLDYPPILKQSFQQLRTRCLYLKYLKRHQFDPTKPNFVSLKDLCVKTNDLFCQHVTKTPLKHYLNFMKTL
ncbi:unnamed protein product [Rotaria magnacalcarata]|uniref:Uncharacterized protein n=2 Tax=Rotaria magnacalcarata TaxID=392030 RepID=A0A819B6D9_9BILA|nr:unnamed protein product [Rotaria magnacalcarata]CAF1580031.1 unnamed protein product [Rotaria magnacalcarata]CAF2101425.1 unnamed protein product [Rotaria magnacalcarata]CAF2117295.1 unnamed protein product [Rotaria magnacalcarata]CAF3791494.1 unnamed protein product [Rotaria magnacalcarata]